MATAEEIAPRVPRKGRKSGIPTEYTLSHFKQLFRWVVLKQFLHRFVNVPLSLLSVAVWI
jgi:hypothetical protein